MKRILLLALALLSGAAALAQSNPGFVFGQVPTTTQWNSYFAAKTDYFPAGLPIASGGTGATTAPLALRNLGGGATSGSYLRGNGTGVVLSTIQAGDVPTLNQNTTGTAASLSGGAAGSLPYQSAAGVTSMVTGNTSTVPSFLTSTGSGSVAQTPTFTTSTGTGSVVLATSPIFATDASSPKWRSTGAKVLIQGAGSGATQISSTQTTAPTCSTNCGTSPSVAGTDSDGIVTMGGTGTPASGWVLTFNGTWPSQPACMVQSALTGMAAGKAPIVVSTGTTTFTVTTNGVAPANSDKYAYICRGTQ